ncbi:hypothetical protein BFP76_00095 [Amylibacter kogurei]|uniref:Uncharacterized protein n=1 Tax=Paramylibacter kogurei TaxID=1889778 RepID=A0A2G5K7R8_9RHOB|nr:hypothetical protein [Amylibacter kogurei]PIB25581.1 hypothetical protein BFP76_00095 [Amylibacter kogurei]
MAQRIDQGLPDGLGVNNTTECLKQASIFEIKNDVIEAPSLFENWHSYPIKVGNSHPLIEA